MRRDIKYTHSLFADELKEYLETLNILKELNERFYEKATTPEPTAE